MKSNAFQKTCRSILWVFVYVYLLRLFPDANYLAGTNRIESEFTQCRVFFSVNRSPSNTCPKCPPQFAHWISILVPSSSGIRFTAPGMASSKAGQPQPASNLSVDRYSSTPHLRQMKVPFSEKLSYFPVNGGSA